MPLRCIFSTKLAALNSAPSDTSCAATASRGETRCQEWRDAIRACGCVQFTYFQQAGGRPLAVPAVEITYGLERILMSLQVGSRGTQSDPSCCLPTQSTAHQTRVRACLHVTRYNRASYNLGAVHSFVSLMAGTTSAVCAYAGSGAL